jgi:hypothetical protein
LDIADFSTLCSGNCHDWLAVMQGANAKHGYRTLDERFASANLNQ